MSKCLNIQQPLSKTIVLTPKKMNKNNIEIE